MSASAPCPRPLFRFGVITDVQYADVPDAWNFIRTEKRRHRGVLESVRLAVQDWQQEGLGLVVDLGDIIDQQCEARGDSHAALQAVLREWAPLAAEPVAVERVIGNHELYNFDRESCSRLIPGITPWYRSFSPVPGWRFVVLDTYDVNMIERGNPAAVEEGLQMLSRSNPNDLRAPRGTVDIGAGLCGSARRFLPMSGALRGEQLRWLRETLCAAAAAGERVLVLSHQPLLAEAALWGAVPWNNGEVLEVLRGAGEGVVAAVLAGHYHAGGYALDPGPGTHHVTLESPLGTTPQEPLAHAVVELWDDRLEIRGRGLVRSRTLPYRTAAVPCLGTPGVRAVSCEPRL